MRRAIALGVLIAALAAASVADSRPTGLNRSYLVPSAIAFSDRMHGVLGLASPHCDGCNPRGGIALTSDGGRSWRVVRRLHQRVVAVEYFHDAFQARLENGETLWANNDARRWQRSTKELSFKSTCPKDWNAGITADVVDANIDRPWSVCTGPPGAGNQEKAVYRGSKRVAFTPFAAHGGYGGISVYGYAVGIAGVHGGFGILWETRGTLYVTRDGGHNWHALSEVAVPEVDFGSWATVLEGGIGFVILERNGNSRLIETTDRGHSWRVVHRWR
jgi:hypothetical protein